jgi:hypothetical protein
MIRITFAPPEAHISDANQLARVAGYSVHEDQTYESARY